MAAEGADEQCAGLASASLKLSVDPNVNAPYMRSKPAFRAITRASLKRKVSSEDKVKTTRPRKLARMRSTTSNPASDTNTSEPATLWPEDVPRSMLSTFRVVSSPFQAYDSSVKTFRGTPSRTTSQFTATGPEPMFDHSWRVAFIEHTRPSKDKFDDAPLHPVNSALCAIYEVRDSPADVPIPPVFVQPSPCTSGPLLRRIPRRGDEDRSPAMPTSNISPDDSGMSLEPLNARENCSLGPSGSFVNRRTEARGPAYLQFDSTPNPHGVNGTAQEVETKPDIHHAELHDVCTSIPPVPWFPHPPTSTLPHIHVPPPAVPAHPGMVAHATSGEHLANSARMGDHSALASTPTPLVSGDSLRLAASFCASKPEYVRWEPPFSPYMHFPPPPSVYPPSYAGHSPQHQPTACAPFPLPHSLDDPANTLQPAQSHMPPHVTGLTMPYSYAPAIHHPVPVDHQAYGSPYLSPPQVSPYLATPWCALFDTLKRGNKGGRGTSKKKRRAPPDTTAGDATTISEGAVAPKRVPTNEDLRCPFCPRVFARANSFTIHLKWHWGATALEWKRGVNKHGKGIERAMRDAERRRAEADRLHSELEQAFCGESSAMGNHESHVALFPVHEPGNQFSMPVIAQSSFDSFFNFSFGSDDQAGFPESLPASVYVSPMSPVSVCTPPPASSSGSSTGGSVPRTPELPAESGPPNAASAGNPSPTWSEDLFGCDGGKGEGEGEADPNGEDDLLEGDDLFGDGYGDGSAPGGNAPSAEDNVSSDQVLGRVSGRRAASSVFVSVSRASRRHLPSRPPPPPPPPPPTPPLPPSRTFLLSAPRMALLRLPRSAPLEDDADDSSADDCEDTDYGSFHQGPVPSLLHPILPPLAPIDDFMSLQSLPELDALESLSLS